MIANVVSEFILTHVLRNSLNKRARKLRHKITNQGQLQLFLYCYAIFSWMDRLIIQFLVKLDNVLTSLSSQFLLSHFGLGWTAALRLLLGTEFGLVIYLRRNGTPRENDLFEHNLLGELQVYQQNCQGCPKFTFCPSCGIHGPLDHSITLANDSIDMSL